MSSRTWSPHDIGDLTGHFVVVTGSSSGIGVETAAVFARHGANVLLACRDIARGERARTRIQRTLKGSSDVVRVARLDVSDLDSVRDFVGGIGWQRVDVLVNNAGVMGGAPVRSAQGFDRQVATNHLGPFALTAGLWPLLEAAPAGRVVNVSSLAARGGALSGSFGAAALTDFTPYREMAVYGLTKQANLLFTAELARRAAAAGSTVTAAAAHPGLARTNLFNLQFTDQGRGWMALAARPILAVALQSAAAGAMPSVRAATDPSVPSGGFVGPHLFGGTRGAPVVIPMFASGDQPAAAAALWSASEELTGVRFTISGSAPAA